MGSVLEATTMKTTSFTQLNVRQSAHRATVAIYKLTRGCPADERYGLSSQMRRAAVSVPSNRGGVRTALFQR